MNTLKTRFFVGSGLATLMIVMPLMASAATLYRQLQVGMSGSDVSDLQTFLARDASIYPQGLVTGYFGTLTSAAVSNFQVRNGIANVGRVGPVTMAAINAQMGGVTISSGVAPLISGLSVITNTNSATVAWNTNKFATGVVYYSTSPLVTYENANSVNVSGNTAMTDTNFRSSHSVNIPSLSSNTTYYYLVYTTDQSGNVSVSWPATFHTN